MGKALVSQRDSEQACLLGTNVTSLLGLKFLRAGGQPLRTDTQPVARVRLVKTVSIPSKIVKAEIESCTRKGEHCVFEPDIEVVDASGLSIPETVLTVGEKGRVYVSLQNLQTSRVKLVRGTELGNLEPLVEMPTEPCTPSRSPEALSHCAKVSTEELSDAHKQSVLQALSLSQGELTNQEFIDLKTLMLQSADVFALDSSELGHTDLVQHTIDTGEHPLIKQQPYDLSREDG